jgi:hypothetical protein
LRDTTRPEATTDFTTSNRTARCSLPFTSCHRETPTPNRTGQRPRASCCRPSPWPSLVTLVVRRRRPYPDDVTTRIPTPSHVRRTPSWRRYSSPFQQDRCSPWPCRCPVSTYSTRTASWSSFLPSNRYLSQACLSLLPQMSGAILSSVHHPTI